MSEVNKFVELSKVNVNGKTEKKGMKNNNPNTGFTYLSWAFAVEEIMKADPNANWEIHEPKTYQLPQGNQVMVSCTVTVFDKPIYMWLPVMNHANQPINNPSVTDINKSQMRCLVKAIACHGLGLYIYAGEDLPSDDDVNAHSLKQLPVSQAATNQGAQMGSVKQLPTLSDERFNGAVQAVKNGQFDKLKLLTDYQLTEQQKQIAQGL